MIRSLYKLVLSMHPPAFRERFRDQMLCVFDEGCGAAFGSGFLSDALRSLARQWVRRVDCRIVSISALLLALQFCWFWRVLQKPSGAVSAASGRPDTQSLELLLFALISILFGMIAGVAGWSVHVQGRRMRKLSTSRRRMITKRCPGRTGARAKAALTVSLAVIFVHVLNARETPAQEDKSLHSVQWVEVEPKVKLEVLDWGGKGLPLVFLAGAGFDAHVFDQFAPKFAAQHHVFAITRRGFGKSSAPAPTGDNYSADRLGDDVVAALDSLHVRRPVLIGHSLAGEEMSSIAARHPEKVAGLVYLDAGYSYAYYAPAIGDPIIDATELHEQLNGFLSKGFHDTNALRNLQKASGQLDRDLKALLRLRALLPPQISRPQNEAPPAIPLALSKGRRKYTQIRVPVLAIFADPHDFGAEYNDNPKARAALREYDRQTTSAQAAAFQAGVPSARVVRIPDADHFIFRSNEADVRREIDAFVAGLR